MHTSQPLPSASHLASPERRIAAWAIDCVLFGAAFVLPQVAAMISLLAFDPTRDDPGSAVLGPLTGVFGSLLLPMVVIAVRVLGEGSRLGGTPGKLLLGIRVVDPAGGDRIGVRRALVRRFWHLLARTACFVGCLGVMNDPQRRGWADLRAGTIVVRT